MARVLVIVSPTIGERAKSTLDEVLSRRFSAAGHAWECWTAEAGDAFVERVRRRLASGIDWMVAAGGDGTVAAVADVLAGGETPFGIVPMGTGNLVARELGVPVDVEEAVALLAQTPQRRRIDAMRINGRTYLLNAGVGINAEVIDQTSRLGKSLFGRSAYVGTAVWKVLQAKQQRLEIAVDGDSRVYLATDVWISNCGILAKALNPNGPDIRVDDGRLDVCVVCMKSPLDYPWYYFLKWIAPWRVNRIMRELVAEKRVSVRSRQPIMVQADGDIIGTTPVDVEVLPGALTLLVPSERRTKG